MLKANIISIHKNIRVERAHTTCNVAATVRCREGWEPGDSVYWAKTVWLRTRVRTKSAQLTLAPRHVSMCLSGLQRVSQIPRWVTSLTISTEWELFSRMGEYSQASFIPVAIFSLLAAQERRSGPTQVVRPQWGFVRGWNNLWQISNLSNRRRQRLQVRDCKGRWQTHKNKLFFFVVKKVSENWGTLWGW